MLLLHLSDLHFRKDVVQTALDPNQHLRNELLRDVRTLVTSVGPVAAVLISGDVAFAGDRDEYKFALAWIEELCNACGTAPANVVVIPGNHDVSRAVTGRPHIQALHRDIKSADAISAEARLRAHLTDPESKRLLYESITEFNHFAGQFFCDLLPPDRTIAKRALPLNDGSVLNISGLNSTFASSVADKAGDLFVDPASFQISRDRGVVHLVMCHHPYSWLRQGDDLKDHLNDVAKIHLFGHEHTNRIELGRDWVRVAASAAHPDKEERGWEPGYNLIDLEVEGTGTSRKLRTTVHVRLWQSRPGQFRAKMDGAEDAFRQTIRLEPWERPTDPASLTTENDESSARDKPPVATLAEGSAMDTLRDISIRFFKLTLSQKAAIAGSLSLLEDEDVNQPDFERFRRVLLRAKERNLVEALDRAVKDTTAR